MSIEFQVADAGTLHDWLKCTGNRCLSDVNSIVGGWNFFV